MEERLTCSFRTWFFVVYNLMQWFYNFMHVLFSPVKLLMILIKLGRLVILWSRFMLYRNLVDLSTFNVLALIYWILFWCKKVICAVYYCHCVVVLGRFSNEVVYPDIHNRHFDIENILHLMVDHKGSASI